MKRAIPGIILIFLMTVICFGCQAMTEEAGANQGTTYYVATDGNDKNPGSNMEKKNLSLAGLSSKEIKQMAVL
nr:hypothetical protein [Bacillus pumilus]